MTRTSSNEKDRITCTDDTIGCREDDDGGTTDEGNGGDNNGDNGGNGCAMTPFGEIPSVVQTTTIQRQCCIRKCRIFTRFIGVPFVYKNIPVLPLAKRYDLTYNTLRRRSGGNIGGFYRVP